MPVKKRTVAVTINQELCKGCSLCVQVCPRHALQLASYMGARGFHPAQLTDPDGCTGCAQCALMCPDACITIARAVDSPNGDAHS